MKRNRKYNLFGWLAVSTLLLTTACAGVADFDGAQTDIKGSNAVTLTVQSQTQMGSMRDAKEDPLTKNITISRGDKADVLIFAVYKKVNDKYELDKKFAKGNQSTNFKTTEDLLANGQTAIDVESYPIKLQFVFDDDTKYKVAFWAQNGETKAYDTKDLQSVKVNYANAKNNDELRDAFCAVSPELSSSTKLADPVTLCRPLAQVNVGSTGWDYEGAAYLKPSNTSYTQSTIILHGVAQYYDILKGEAIVDKDHPETSVTFSDDIIPAFINVEGDQWDTLSYKPFDNEEFLKVHVNTGADDTYVPYVGWKEFDNYRLDDNKGSDGKSNKEKYEDGVYPSTEVFKYLSMCYVLVPENTSTGTEEQLNSVLSSVEFKFKGITADEDGNFNTNESAEYLDQKFVVNNVPVQKNWRTNILGNAFFTCSPKFIIDVVPEYMGDFRYDSEEWGNPTDGKDWPKEEGETYSISFDNHNSNCVGNPFFTFNSLTDKHSHAIVSGTYEGKKFSQALKMEGNTRIKFTTTAPSTVTIVQATSVNPDSNVKLDGKDQSKADAESNSTNQTRVYTIKDVPAGSHEISQGSDGTNIQTHIYLVKVQTQTDIKDDTWDKNEGFEYE